MKRSRHARLRPTYSRKNRLYRAFCELGRVIRTGFLLRYISDTQLRSTIQGATNKSEPLNRFLKWTFFGGEGVIAENSRDEQRKTIKYNHLIANCLIFHNLCSLTQLVYNLELREKPCLKTPSPPSAPTSPSTSTASATTPSISAGNRPNQTTGTGIGKATAGRRNAPRRTTSSGCDRHPGPYDRRQFQTSNPPPYPNRASSHRQRPKPCVSRGRRGSQRQPRDRTGLRRTTPNKSEILRQIIIKATL